MAAARNRGAEASAGDVLWFVDADVKVHPDGAGKIVDAMKEDQVTAVIGSYDDQPPASNFLSQYKNLVHHHYHQKAEGFASGFWGGCGAVQKEAFSTSKRF